MGKQLLWQKSLVFILVFVLVFPNLSLARVHADSGANLTVESAVADDLDGSLNGIIYANGKYTAVGDGGRIIQSADGLSWTRLNVPSSNAKISWRSIAFTSGTYVVAGIDANSGSRAALIVSVDGGVTWTDKSAAINASILQNVRYLNGAFYAVGGRWHSSVRAQDLGVIYTSADGQTWSQLSTVPYFLPPSTSSSTPFYLMDIGYINGNYVITGNGFSSYAYSSNGGINWTVKFLGGSYALDSLSLYNGKLHVTHNWNEGYSSSDGTNFTADASYNNMLGIAQVGSLLYRYGKAGAMYTSTDGGASWTAATTVTNHTIRSAASNGTGMVLITFSKRSLVVTPDRIIWKRIVGDLQGAATNGNVWGTVGTVTSNSGGSETPDGTISSSSSGWNQLSPADNLLPALGFAAIAYGNNLFVAGGKKFAVSADGQTWSTSDLPGGSGNTIRGLAYGGIGFVAVSDSDTILTSANGTSWTAEATLSGAKIFNVKYVDGTYVAFGENGVWASTDGTAWDSLDSLVSYSYAIYDVTYANGKYIVVYSDGDDGSPRVLETTGTLSSTSVWTEHIIEESSNWTDLYSIDYGNGIYVAVGSVYDDAGDLRHVAYSSNDLETWTKYDEQALGVSGGGLNQVTYLNEKFYIVGNGNTKIVLGNGGVVEATPGAVIDFAAEQLTGLTANASYTVNGNAVTADSTGKLAIEAGWLGASLSIVKKGVAPTTTDSIAQVLSIPARPAAPSSVGKTDQTAPSVNDGTLTNVSATMEYKQGTSGTWTNITGTSVTDLAPDTYYVRTKATSSAFASGAQSVTVDAFTAAPEATPAAAIDYAAEQLTGLTANASYTVNGNTVTADSNGKLAIEGSWLGTSLSIVKKGVAPTTTDSAAQVLSVPSRPAAPSSVGKTNQTAPSVNDGTLTNVSATMEYKQGTSGTWTNITGTSVTDLAPDTYYVRMKATSSAFASGVQDVTVAAFTAAPEATPAAAIDYAAEQLTGLTANASYTVNGNTVTADSNGKLTVEAGWLGATLSIVKKGDGSATTDSAAQVLGIPSRPAAPSSVGKTNETAPSTNDGTLTNVTAAMEYKQGTSGAWTQITGTSVTGLAPDTYYVRTKATSSAFASSSQSVTIDAFTAAPEATPAAVIDYAAEQLTGLTANASYTVNGNTVTADSTGKLAIEGSWLGTSLSIVKKGDGSATTDSIAQTLIVPYRPATPSSVGKTNETAPSTNDGTLTNVTATMEYKQGTSGTWTNITGTSVTDLAPDTYYVRTKATSSTFASGAQSVTVAVFTAAPEATPAAEIDFAAEQLTGLTANASYTVNGDTVTADSNGKLTIEGSWLGATLSIVKKGVAPTTTDSSAQVLIVPSRPAAPSGVGKTNETAPSTNDGTLTNVSATMEYKQGTSGAWTPITGTSVTGLAPDTYYVRTKATSSAFASGEQSVTVAAFTAAPEATPAAEIDFAAEQLTGLTANASYTVNGDTVTADSNGKLTIEGSWLGATLSIVKKGVAPTTTDSIAQVLSIPARPAAPSSVGKTDQTAPSVNDGTLTNVSAAMEYKQGTSGAWTPITGTSVTDLAPDTYYVRTKATTSDFASGVQSVTVAAFTAAPEATPAAVIDYTAEQLTGLTANASYTVNGNAVTADSTGKLAIEAGWLGTSLSIVKLGDGSATTDSAAQVLGIPYRPAAPSSVGKTNETAPSTNDGTLTNVTAAMEYKQGTSGAWTPITGTSVTGLAPDTYYVRTKATSSAFASGAQSVTVDAFTAAPEATPAAAIDYAAEQLTGLTANASYTVNGNTVTADSTGKLAIEGSWLGTSLSIVKKGDGSATTDSIAQTLIVPSRPAAPVGVTVTDITYGGANNGMIQNVTLQMEYKKGSTGIWTDVADTFITSLVPDTYYVRVKATVTAFASFAAQATVHDSNAVIPSAPEVTADDLNNSISGLDTSMEFSVDGGDYVRYNGTNLPALNGEHTVKVRVAASGSVPAGPATTLTFTADITPVPAGGLTVSASDPRGTANDGKTQITVTTAPVEGHKLLYKNYGTGSVIVPNVGDSLVGYTVVGSDGLIPAGNGDTIGIAEVDADGKVVKYGSITAAVAAEPVTPVSNTNNANGPSNGNATGNTPAVVVTDVIVLVNGKQENAGTATTTAAGTIKTTTITVDPVKLQAKLDAEGNGAVITIPVTLASNIFVGELNGQMIKNMENRSATLVLQTNNASYVLPAKEINIGALAQQFGTGVKLEDIKLKITIGEASASMNQVITRAAGTGRFTLVAPSLDFTVTGTYGNSTVEISRFDAYVKRTVALPDGIDPNRITTGIVVDPDGTVRHVPTRVIRKDGKYYAEINSLTNSTYSVVWHPLAFADVENHWAKDAVNDMGSRMVINGVNETTFNPNADITRAEFAAIIVRGMGLKLGEGKTAFADVSANSWYAGAVETASDYGLITGFEDGLFRPDAVITREQAMNIIAKAMKLSGLADRTGAADAASVLASFGDAGNVGSWARDSLALAVKAGLITGRSGNKLEAKNNVTRAEVAVLIQRLLQKSELTN